MLRKPPTRLDVLDQEDIKEYETQKLKKYNLDTVEMMNNIPPVGTTRSAAAQRIGYTGKKSTINLFSQ